MFRSTISSSLALWLCMVVLGPVSGQDNNVAPTGYFNAIGDKQEDDEKQALAKTLDDFQKRIAELESQSAGIQEAQKEKSFTERFEVIEEDVRKSLDSVGKIEDSFDNYVRSGHGNNRMRVAGRIHLDYWNFLSEHPGIDLLENGDPQDRFTFRRVRFGVRGDIDDNMEYRIEMEFAGGSAVEYRDVYLGFNDLPLLNTVLIGNQKRPYGLDHLNSSNNNVFLERPFAVEAFNQDARRLGIASYGHTEDLCYNWRYGLYNQELVQLKNGYIGDHYQPEFAARLAKTWWWDKASDGRGYGHWGISGSMGWPDGTGPNNQARYRTRPEARSTFRWLDTGVIDGADTFLLGGLEGVLNVGPTQIVAEYQLSDVNRTNAVGPDVQFHGGYVYASYFLTGEHIPWERQSGTIGRVRPFENFFAVCDCDGYAQRGLGAWQVAVRYSYADFTDQDILGGRGRNLTFGLNWYWNAWARLQFNYMIGDIETDAVTGGDYQIAGLRMGIDF